MAKAGGCPRARGPACSLTRPAEATRRKESAAVRSEATRWGTRPSDCDHHCQNASPAQGVQVRRAGAGTGPRLRCTGKCGQAPSGWTKPQAVSPGKGKGGHRGFCIHGNQGCATLLVAWDRSLVLMGARLPGAGVWPWPLGNRGRGVTERTACGRPGGGPQPGRGGCTQGGHWASRLQSRTQGGSAGLSPAERPGPALWRRGWSHCADPAARSVCSALS